MEKKEAMKILKDFHDKSALFSVRTALDTIIPELRESNDEKIRQKFIKLVKMSNEVGGFALHKWEADEMLAWVEKQGKERTVNYPIEGMFPYTDPADTLDGEIENIWNKLRNCDNTFTAAKSGFYEVIHHFANWLEKQGKETSEKEFTFKALPRLLEMIEVSDRAKAYTEKLAVALDNECYHTDAKIVRESIKIMNGEEVSMATMDEQKPVDNIEPKFKVGDWIVWQNKCYKVNYNGCGYELIDQNGLSTSLEYGTVDKSAHLWTIQDAKDGDVLQLGVVTVIFQEYIGNGNCKCYYSVCNGEFEIPTKDESYGTFNATPATKEQRDLLFSKMKDAGYEWDAQEKELKLLISNGGDFESENCIQKTTKWNKEDEIRLNRICKTLWKNRKGDIDEMYQQEKDIDWLKSLKNRVQPHSQPAWSEEDENNLNSCISKLEIDMQHWEGHGKTMVDGDRKLISWLKSLRPQNTWKPSDEQIKALKEACDEHWESDGLDPLYTLWEQLKKLREE